MNAPNVTLIDYGVYKYKVQLVWGDPCVVVVVYNFYVSP